MSANLCIVCGKPGFEHTDEEDIKCRTAHLHFKFLTPEEAKKDFEKRYGNK